MKDSNIYFATNTYNYGKEYHGQTKNFFNESKGNSEFFRQVMDYDALKRLKNHPKMRGSLNSSYYVANINQIHVLDPNFSSVMLQQRKIDPVIEAENRKNDLLYGYCENNDYYPLLEEIIIDSNDYSYADEMLGKWELSNKGLDEDNKNLFGIYIKQRIEIDNATTTVRPEDAGFEDIDDTDPYYYLYKENAGKRKSVLGDLNKAKLYESKYGSIFRAFREASQEEIIHAPVEQYSFVNAGPGTGKTYTLLKKIAYMIDTLEADPEGILVLCFTNAAVNEIKARINKYSEEKGNRSFVNVDVRTFHSFSWILINQANELFQDRSKYRYIDISSLNYDKSVYEATKIIKNFGDEVFGNVEHLIVDEIQDLTNERASLVIAMVQECMNNNVGVTILGDSCQAIYDYSDEDTTFVLKSDRFYKYMFSAFFERGEFYKIENNYRQTDWLIKNTSPLRKAILEGKKETIRSTIEKLSKNVSELEQGVLSSKISRKRIDEITENKTVCLMCRNNAQVLATSSNLRKRGINHIVNAYDEFKYHACWIGKVFSLFTKEIITLEEFIELFSKVNDDIKAKDVWERLQEITGNKNNVLKVFDILKAAERTKIDDPIFRNNPKGNLIVSNIHKSKGREYDTVIVEKKFVKQLLNESASFKSVQRYLEEAKTLYVAVTRPRTNLYFNILSSPNVSLEKIRTGRKRWIRGDGEGRNLKRIEIRALTDADIESFKSPDTQEYIINNVSEGDEINLVMNLSTGIISYGIYHISPNGERKIGDTTVALIEDIDAIITPHGSPWPKRIKDLYVSGIHSHISQDCRSVWCWVDFCGLGNAVTDAY